MMIMIFIISIFNGVFIESQGPVHWTEFSKKTSLLAMHCQFRKIFFNMVDNIKKGLNMQTRKTIFCSRQTNLKVYLIFSYTAVLGKL